MNLVTDFLESSSIAGLSLIAGTRSFRRVFWVAVVTAAFTTAFCIIDQSLSNWAENPVTTTVETIPITEIRFPKVTVCPPQDTYTNLNYDLMMVGNMSIDQVRTSQFEDFVKLVKNMTDSIQNYESTAASKLYFEEENKFQNWFDGYSFEENPLIEKRFNNKKIGNMEYSGVEQKVTSCATSGVIKTPKFGEPFDTSVFINGNPNFPNQPYLFSINLDIEKMQFVENKSIDLTLNIETDQLSLL